ncbi:MAG: hypothetical protein IIB36_20175 [Gemmatimonadetes bacterium]|nr:hypothetical protein [Gemmatimonadota bacterium]
MGVLISGGIGGAVGYSTHKTQEEVLKALEEERTPASTLSKETNRALLELWRMEDVEAARGRRGR